ncbi:unnamed protein product [Mytilus edulis]|uniref:CCHC-type domain-containing protein n=1 Tax=Mytilus edulis TaxID=6550 RepID=A0A8S3RCV8_MYTED|nr:unnamed protein product [Mytilus edulis]
MKADYGHRIAAVNQDFTVKMKNRVHDYEQQYDNLAKRQKEDMEELINKFNERELKLNQSIEERDEQMKKIQMTMKIETDDKTRLQEMVEKWSLPKEKPSMKIAETKDEPSWKTKTNTHTGQASKRQDGLLSPKMSTYDGRSDWRPYLVQFNHIANRYNWTNQNRLDKLIECLRDRALKFLPQCQKEDVQDTRSSTKQILNILKRDNSSIDSDKHKRFSSPGRTPIRDNKCFNCGEEGHFIAQGAGACSEINAGIAENVNLDIGSSTVKWDMVVAEITDNLILVELHGEQMKDSDLKTLKRWIEDKYEPTKAELKLCSEVVRHVWSLRQQIQIKDNILLYKWEDPISPRLLFMTPKQMPKELLHG